MDKPKVIVYGTDWCSYCHSLMDWLDQLGVAYEHIDVEADAEAKAEMLAKNGGEFLVPVTVIGSDTVAGFDRPAVKKALDKHGIKHA